MVSWAGDRRWVLADRRCGATQRSAIVRLRAGTFAISVMGDLDSSGDLNTSLVGRPKEPWGVSNDVPAERFGPPAHKDCTFKYEGGKKGIKIELQH